MRVSNELELSLADGHLSTIIELHLYIKDLNFVEVTETGYKVRLTPQTAMVLGKCLQDLSKEIILEVRDV